jgi:hypothetical protein
MGIELYTVDENIPKVIAFPTDHKIRVVLAYGALIENHNGESNLPKVEVLLKEIVSENQLHNIPLVIKIEFTEIDIVRVGTIWQGRHRLNERWKVYKDYKENIEFRFDFVINQPEYIKHIDKNPKNNKYYFTKEVYDLNEIQSKYGFKHHFANAIYTKLTTNTGTTVLIHGLELLTSTYLPQEKNIRGKLLNKPIDSILDEYVEEDSFLEDDIYYMHFKENKRLANNVFLSYAKYNQTTRTRLSKLRASLESGSYYNDRYPIVLPYHPGKMRMIVDGLWLDEETFLVLRIKGCSLPKENVLEIKKTKEEATGKTVTSKVESENESENSEERKFTRDNEEGQKKSEYIKPSEIDIDSSKRAHKRNPTLQIVSEVEILDEDDVEVSYVEEIKQKNNYAHKTEYVAKKKESDDIEEAEKFKNNEENQIDAVSSGDIGQADKDKGTTTFEVLNKIEKSQMLILVENALKDMKNKKETIDSEKKVYISKLSYLNESCLESEIDKRPKFYSFIDSWNNTQKSWCIIKNDREEKEDYRRFMLIKIELSNGQYAYLLEIDRKSASESYSGFIFNYLNQEISDSLLKNLVKTIVLNKGKYSKRDKKAHRMIDLIYPVNIQKIYGHQTIKDSMYKKIKRVINEAYIEGLFRNKINK